MTAPSQLETNLADVRGRIAQAAQRSGRSPQSIQLVAVTKYVDAQAARQLVAAGCRALGESRPQELWVKAQALSDLDVQWHLVGHLQTNKVRRTVALVTMIHSVDSLRLLDAIERHAADFDRSVDVLLEVNVSRETAKHGLAPEQVGGLLPWFAGPRRTRLRGLMCMAGLDCGTEQTRRQFAGLRQLRDQLRGALPPNASLDELSMGMSGDFEVAVEEGATIVRIGSILFGQSS